MVASTDIALDGFTGALALMTGLLAAATFVMAKKTARAVDAAEREAQMSAALVAETRKDRVLAMQPFLVLLESTSPRSSVRLKNIGKAPALHTMIAMLSAEGRPLRSQGMIAIPAGAETGWIATAPTSEKEYRYDDIVAYCRDLLGNRLRFDLLNGGPPMVRPGYKSDKWPPGTWVAIQSLLDLQIKE